MLDVATLKEVMVSFAGTLLAVIFAGLTWLLKKTFERHRAEKLALARFERLFALNLTLLRDNFGFLNEWIKHLKDNRPFSVVFQDYYTNDEETLKISNLKVINLILPISYKLRRTSIDINNLQKNYWETLGKIDSIPDKNSKERDLRFYHQTVIQTLSNMENGFEPLKNEIVNLVATIRATARVRTHSLFGYIEFLSVDVFPRVNEKVIQSEVKILQDNIKRMTQK